MLCFPNIKVNLGLNILSKRPDGYHNIETVFYPIGLHDMLEIVPAATFAFVNEGLKIDCPVEENLCYKAFRLIEREYSIPPVKIILYKNIPFKSGLGAASSDATHTLLLLNRMFHLGIDTAKMMTLAASLGADCPFFVKNTPALASGKGDILTDVTLSLSGRYIVLCFPNVAVNTGEAYRSCVPQMPAKPLRDIIAGDIKEWRHSMKNDFESGIFGKYPQLQAIKAAMYEHGAVYAQMSGSGAAIFGLFDAPAKLPLDNYKTVTVGL